MGNGRLSNADSLAPRGRGKLGWLPSSNALSSSSHSITTAGLLHLFLKVSLSTLVPRLQSSCHTGYSILSVPRTPSSHQWQSWLRQTCRSGHRSPEMVALSAVCCYERAASAHAKSGMGLGLRNESQRLLC